MSRFTLTTSDAKQQSVVFNLQEPTTVEDIITLPAGQSGLYILGGVNDSQDMAGLSLSRHGDELHIHTEQAVMPSAIIQDYYSTPAMLTVPVENNLVMAVSTENVQVDAEPVALATVTDTPNVPWAPGLIVVDNAVDDNGTSIGQDGTTNDLTPTLQGHAEHGHQSILLIYANTVLIGSAQVDENDNWTFTPPADFEMDSSYTFQVLLKNPGGSSIIIAMPFTISETSEATAPDNLPHPGDTGDLDIIGLVDDFGLHQGTVSDNGVTDDLTPTIEGTVLHGGGLYLHIYANTLYLGSTRVDDNGHWSFDVSELPPDSQFTIQALFVNPGGSDTFIGLPFVFSTGFDYSAPVITNVSDDSGIYTGELASAHPTDDTTPTFTGTADAGATVNIYDGDTFLGAAVASPDGIWTFTPPKPLSGDGQHLISVTATDGTNETVHSDQFIVDLDTVCGTPVIAGITDDQGVETGDVANGGKTDDMQPLLHGTGEAESLITIYMYSAAEDKSVVIGSVTVAADGSWEYQFTPEQSLSIGENVFHITAVDVAGNQAAGSDYTVVGVDTNQDDTTIPDATTITVTDNVKGGVVGALEEGGLTNDSHAVISGQATAGDKVIISDHGAEIGTAIAGADGNWSFTPKDPLADGEHEFTAVVVNQNNGAESAVSPAFDITVDTVVAPPVITVAFDDVGVQTGYVANGGKTDDTTITFEGTGEPNGTIILYQIGSQGRTIRIGQADVDSEGHWTFENKDGIQGLYVLGNHTFFAEQYDEAGNRSGRSDYFILNNVSADKDDTSTPDASTSQVLLDDVGNITGAIHENDTTDDNLPTFEGEAAAGTTVFISDNGAVIGSARVGEDGKWSFTPDKPLADGQHSFSTVVRNPNNGNESPASDAINFIVDTAVPEVAIVSVADDVDPVTGDIANNGATNDATPTLNGTATAGALVNIYDNNALIGTAIATAEGKWTFTPKDALADGEHDFTATVVTAAAGESAQTDAWVVNIDTSIPDPIDITTPDNLVVFDDIPAITGNIDNGGVTNDANPDFSGKNQHPGDIITILDHGVVLGTAEVQADGTWTFTPDKALAEGEHEITLTATDAAGNVSDESAAFDFTVDTVIPDATTGDVLSDDVGPVTGTITDGTTTDDNLPTFNGQGEPGTTVQIRDNGEVIGTADVGADGTWNFTPETPLADGSHSFDTVVVDGAGNASTASDAINFIVDTAVPEVAIVSVADDVDPATGDIANNGATNDSMPTLNGTATAGALVNIYDNNALIGTAIATAEGKWTFTPKDALADGEHDFTATVVTAAAGESAQTDAWVVNIDTSIPDPIDITTPDNLVVFDDIPAITGNIDNGGVTNDANPDFSGKNQHPGDIITILDHGVALGTAEVQADGTWTFTPDKALAEGEHEITLTATDAAGNVSDESAAFDFTVDTVIPDATTGDVLSDDVGPITGTITDGTITDDNLPTFDGQGEPGTTVQIRDNGEVIGTADVGADGTWNFTPETPLADGSHSFDTVVVDGAGNEGTASDAINFIVDTAVPEVAIVSVADDVDPATGDIANNGATNDATPTLNGTATAGALVNIYDNNALIGTAIATAEGKWTFTPKDALADGEHDFTATVVTAAAGESAQTDAWVVNIDTSIPDPIDITTPDNLVVFDDIPAITGNIDNGGVTNDANPDFSGKNQHPGDIITILDHGVALGTAEVQADGTWTFTPDKALAEGEHEITLTATDAAGNVSDESAAFDFTVDTVIPDATTGDVLSDDVGPVTGTITDGTITDDNLPTFDGQGEPGTKVQIRDNGEVIGTADVGADGTWSFTPETPLADGSHSFDTVVVDGAGNESTASDAIGFIVDTIGQTVSIDSVVDDINPVTGEIENGGYTNDQLPTLNGTATANAYVNIYLDDVFLGTAKVSADGKWSFDVPIKLADGEHTFTATVVTATSGESTQTDPWIINVDTIAPGPIDITTPDNLVVFDDIQAVTGNIDNGGVTNDANPDFSGKNQHPGDIITIFDHGTALGTAEVQADGTWSFKPKTALAEGEHEITLTATDAAGNVSTASSPFDFTVDTVAPDAATGVVINDDQGDKQGIVVPNGATDDTMPTIDGQGEPGTTVIINDNGEFIGTAIVNEDGSWSFTPDKPLDNGQHSIDTVVVDEAGNQSGNSEPVKFAIVNEGSMNFEGLQNQNLELNQTITLDNGLSLTSLDLGVDGHGYYNSITDVGLYFFGPDSFGFENLQLLGNSVTKMDFGGETNSVSLDVSSVTGPGGMVTYYDASGVELWHNEIPLALEKDTATVSWEVPEGSNLISYITITVGPETGNSLIRVDNFTWGDTQVEPTALQSAHTDAVAPLEADTLAVDHNLAVDNTHQAGGHLELSVNDVLSHSEQNLFINDGKQQFAVTGEAGEQVQLNGVTEDSLAQHGSVTSGGVTYDVYSVSGHESTELLVQQGLELHTTA